MLNPDDGAGRLVNLSKRDSGGYGGGHHEGYCESTGLEIFVFLLFLVYLLDLIQTILMNAMINIMINDQVWLAHTISLVPTELDPLKEVLSSEESQAIKY